MTPPICDNNFWWGQISKSLHANASSRCLPQNAWHELGTNGQTVFQKRTQCFPVGTSGAIPAVFVIIHFHRIVASVVGAIRSCIVFVPLLLSFSVSLPLLNLVL